MKWLAVRVWWLLVAEPGPALCWVLLTTTKCCRASSWHNSSAATEHCEHHQCSVDMAGTGAAGTWQWQLVCCLGAHGAVGENHLKDFWKGQEELRWNLRGIYGNWCRELAGSVLKEMRGAIVMEDRWNRGGWSCSQKWCLKMVHWEHAKCYSTFTVSITDLNRTKGLSTCEISEAAVVFKCFSLSVGDVVSFCINIQKMSVWKTNKESCQCYTEMVFILKLPFRIRAPSTVHKLLQLQTIESLARICILYLFVCF